MYRVLEAIFQRLSLILLLMVVLPIIAVGVAYILPRSYQSTASLWALRRYAVIGATGPESDIYSTPAETQATALTELLQTRDFALKVAKSTTLAATLNLSGSVLSNQALLDDALFAEVSKKVIVTAQGYNLFTISYTNQNANVAQKIVAAAVAGYRTQSQYLTVAEGQQLLVSYQQQYTQAKQDLNKAALAESNYLSAHPDLSQQVLRTNPDYAALADPQYNILHSQTKDAQSKVNTLQQNIADLQQQISEQGPAADSLFTVIDAPTVPGQAVSRLKLFLIAGGIGLGVALLAAVLYIIIMVRRDRAIYTTHDLSQIVEAVPIVQLPLLSAKAVPLFLEQSLSRSAS